jgi:Ca-activated chloride channel family protein
MKSLTQRLRFFGDSTRVGLIAFGSLALVTAAAIFYSQGPRATPQPLPLSATPSQTSQLQGPGGMKLKTALSQTKLTQGSQGAVYLSLELEPPSTPITDSARKPTDMIVVLDHSPSMGADNKMPFAKQAVIDLLSRLNPEDRFGLVIFDSDAKVLSPLQPVTPAERERLVSMVKGIDLGSGTNIGDGLIKAKELALVNPSDRNRKMLLLSDGETNTGITDPGELNNLARSVNQNGLVLSAIGMGLGFNEVLMTALADHGMGTYAYLERLDGLGEILARDLNDSRKVYARSSEIELRLAPGVSLIDAGGYPITQKPGNEISIPVGQVLSGIKRTLTLSFNVTTANLGELPLADLRYRYQLAEGPAELKLDKQQLVLAVLPREQQKEALASVNKPVMQETWLSNNLGRLKSAYRDAVVSGRKDKAKESLDRYQQEVKKTESALGAAIMNEPTRAELKAMERELDDAFVGAPAEQSLKQNRLGKKAHADALEKQRGAK